MNTNIQWILLQHGAHNEKNYWEKRFYNIKPNNTKPEPIISWLWIRNSFVTIIQKQQQQLFDKHWPIVLLVAL